MTDIDIEHLKTWIGREQRTSEVLSVFPARALAALLNHCRVPNLGDELPPSWHWLYFLDTPTSAGTGADGHPAKGGFLPPVPLPRRMWAAGSVQISKPLRLGLEADKVSKILSVQLKGGKTGALVFVTVEHSLHQAGRLCIREEQTLVYREMPQVAAPLPPGEMTPDVPNWSRQIEPTSVLLFRFSALTYNAHRIHYDRAYATATEFYPALVVHAPLLATLLLDLALDEIPEGSSVASFNFRAIRPTFDAGTVTLRGIRASQEVSLWSSDADQYVGMRVTATLRGNLL